MASILQKYKDYYRNLTQNTIPQRAAQVASNKTLNNIATGNINRFALPSANPKTLMGSTWNVAKAIPESVINIPRNLAVGPARIANEINTSRNTGKPINYTNVASGVGAYAEGAFDLATLGLFNVGKGLAKGAVKEAGKQGFTSAVKKGAVKSALMGAGGGLTYGLDEQYNKRFNVGQVAKNVVSGAFLGGVLGGGIAGVGAFKGLAIEPKGKLDKQLRDAAGRWVKGEKPIKPNGMPKAQWDFQIKFNTKYNRNPYHPVYKSDLTEALNLEGSRRVGMQVRDISKDKLSTSLDPQQSLYDTKLIEEAKKYKSADEFISKVKGSSTQYGDYTPELRGYGMEGYKNVSELGVNPNEKVTIYRGIDKTTGKVKKQINSGDFVTTDFESALAYTGNPKDVVSMEVPAKYLYSDNPIDFKSEPFFTGSEYVYTKNKVSPLSEGQLKEVYNQAHSGGVQNTTAGPIGQSLNPKSSSEFASQGVNRSFVSSIQQPKNVVQGGLSEASLKGETPRTTQIPETLVQPQLPKQNVSSPLPSSVAPEVKLLDKGDPVARITEALRVAKPLRGAQEDIYSKIRSKQAGALSGIQSSMSGEKGYFQGLGQLKGEMPKVQFESIRKQVSQADIDSVFNMVNRSELSPFEKVTAQTGLRKLVAGEGGVVPTEGELRLLNEVFPPDFIEAILDNRSNVQKLFSGIEGTLNLPRAIMATADFSAPMRQGVFLVGRPKQFLPAFRDMFRYAFSEKAYEGLQADIKARPNYKLMRESNLAITDLSPNLLKREEAFMSNLTDKIPVFGRVSRGSNRAYSGFLNKLRVDVFDDLVNTAQKQGIEVKGKTLKDLSSFINSATGRGNLGATMSRTAPILNATFFSPRLIASRLNLLNPVTYAKYDPFVRKEAIKSLLGFGATAGSILGLASLGGAEVGTDPRSANFGKIKVGNTRYDILGGFQQYIKLGAQLYTGQVVSSTSGRVMTLGEGYKPLTRKDIILRFFEGKESPIASFVSGLLTGQTGTGEDFDIPAEVIGRFIPLVVQDVYDIAKDKDSIGQGLAMAIPGIFGVGSQTYGKTELVTGQNQLGEQTSQIRQLPGLTQKIRERVFGKQILGNSKSFDVEQYYDQLLKLPKVEASVQFEQIAKTNPDLAKKISQVAKDRQRGLTVEDKTLKEKGVASGDRAIAIKKEFDKLKTKEEKAKLWQRYVELGIITKDVAKQLNILLNKQ